MRERPILFGDEMVRAILDGRKTQTRRSYKGVIGDNDKVLGLGLYVNWGGQGELLIEEPSDLHITVWGGVVSPFGVPGDRLYVRETFIIESDHEAGPYPPPFDDGRPIRYRHDPDHGSWWEQPHYRATDPKPELAYPDSDEPCCRWRPSIHMPKDLARIWLEVERVWVERVREISEADAYAEGCGAVSWLRFSETWIGPGSWERNDWVWACQFRVLSTTGRPA